MEGRTVVDTKDRGVVICPYCGYKYHDKSRELFDDIKDFDDAEIVCNQCKKEFMALKNTRVTYTSQTMEEWGE